MVNRRRWEKMEKMEEETKKLALDVTIDYIGYADYYSGHGHAFPSQNLVACIRFGFPVTYRETAEELEEAIFNDIVQTWDLDIVDEEYSEEDIELSDAEIKEAVKEEVAKIDFSLYHSYADELQVDDEEPMQEYPELIGYMHIYKTA
jgi:hypothetical protein